MKNAIILNHLGMGDIISMSPSVRYYANKYENIYILSKLRYFNNCMKLYEDVDNINIFSLSMKANDNEYQERLEINLFLNNFEEEYHLFTSGIYKENHTPFDSLPDNFYTDLGLNLDVYNTYFSLPESVYKNTQFDKIIQNYSYLFVCGKTSLEDYSQKIISKINSNFLLLNPSKNFYDIEHFYYEIAESVVGLPIFDYVPLIQNAQELHLIASSFSILSKFVAPQNIKKYLYNYNKCGLSNTFFNGWNIIHN